MNKPKEMKSFKEIVEEKYPEFFCPCGCHLSTNQANEDQVLCMSCSCAFE